MKKKTVLDQDEEKLIAEYDRGVFRPVKNQDRARQEAMEAAAATRVRTLGSISAYRPPTWRC
jgi:hypothetical protein